MTSHPQTPWLIVHRYLLSRMLTYYLLMHIKPLTTSSIFWKSALGRNDLLQPLSYCHSLIPCCVKAQAIVAIWASLGSAWKLTCIELSVQGKISHLLFWIRGKPTAICEGATEPKEPECDISHLALISPVLKYVESNCHSHQTLSVTWLGTSIYVIVECSVTMCSKLLDQMHQFWASTIVSNDMAWHLKPWSPWDSLMRKYGCRFWWHTQIRTVKVCATTSLASAHYVAHCCYPEKRWGRRWH